MSTVVLLGAIMGGSAGQENHTITITCSIDNFVFSQRSLNILFAEMLASIPKPERVFTDSSKNIIKAKACQDLQWAHDTNTPHRSETTGFAERGVRRVKEGNSDSDGSKTLRWNVSASCGTCTTRWPMARQHQLDKKMLPGIFMGYVLRAGGGSSGGLPRPREHVSLRLSRQTVQSRGSRIRRTAVVSMCRRISQALKSSPTSAPWRQAAWRNPEQNERHHL